MSLTVFANSMLLLSHDSSIGKEPGKGKYMTFSPHPLRQCHFQKTPTTYKILSICRVMIWHNFTSALTLGLIWVDIFHQKSPQFKYVHKLVIYSWSHFVCGDFHEKFYRMFPTFRVWRCYVMQRSQVTNWKWGKAPAGSGIRCARIKGWSNKVRCE